MFRRLSYWTIADIPQESLMPCIIPLFATLTDVTDISVIFLAEACRMNSGTDQHKAYCIFRNSAEKWKIAKKQS